jgi:hypothetical protein
VSSSAKRDECFDEDTLTAGEIGRHGHELLDDVVGADEH